MQAAFLEAGSTLAVSPLNLASRKYQDVCFGIVYLVLFAATCAILVFSYDSSAGKAALNDIINSCTTSTRRRLLAGLADDNDLVVPDLIKAAPYAGVALALAVVAGIIWMT